ncbi:hypothetical protein Tco_1548664 [Tanacetum coccineum]
MNPSMPIKAIQEQMQKKFHVVISKDKAFRAKAAVSLRGDVKIQYALLRDYICELKRGRPSIQDQMLIAEGVECQIMASNLCIWYSESRTTTLGLGSISQHHEKSFPHAEHRVFDIIKEASSECIVDWNGADQYQVKGFLQEQYVVNLSQKTCSVGSGDISRPSGHNKSSCDRRQPSQGGTSNATGTKRKTTSKVVAAEVGTQASQGGTSNAAGTKRKSTSKVVALT